MTRQQALVLVVAVLVAAGLGSSAALLSSGGADRLDAAGPTPTPTSPTTPSATPTTSAPAAPSVTEAELQSAPVPSLCGHPAGTLSSGSLPGIPEGEGGVAISEVVLGDLDGDGGDEAAVLMGCNAGNSPLEDVLVYRAGPELVGRVPVDEGLGSDVRGMELTVAAGRISVTGRYQDDDDARCCPTGFVGRQYRLAGGGLERLPAPGVDMGDRLTGNGFSTVRVGATYAELALATGLPVTLETLEDGDVATAACTYVSVVGADVGGIGGDGRLGSVVFSDPGPLSKSGVGVGSTEAQVLAAYGDRATRVPNEYSSVQDVVVPAGDGLIVRFELGEDRVVKTMHGGRTEFAGLIEGCA